MSFRIHLVRRSAFTMIDMLAVVAIIGVLVGLLLPAVQSAREAARRTSCRANLAQVGLAVSGYHDAFVQFPVQLSGTGGNAAEDADNDRRLSIFVALLPFMDQSAHWQQIQSELPRNSDEDFGGMYLETEEPAEASNPQKFWSPGGPSPAQSGFPAWRTEVPVLRCPSDPGTGDRNGIALTNYAACIGDGLIAGSTGPFTLRDGLWQPDSEQEATCDVSMRGIFVPRQITRRTDVTDGLSQTILLGEIATDLGDADKRTEPIVASLLPEPNSLKDDPAVARIHETIDLERPKYLLIGVVDKKISEVRDVRRGWRWCDGMPLFTSFNTILPPNSEIVLVDDDETSDAVVSVSSRHQTGVHVCMADGAVRFVIDTIDAGSLNSPSVYPGSYSEDNPNSPYGVWGALGTRASSEIISRPQSDF